MNLEYQEEAQVDFLGPPWRTNFYSIVTGRVSSVKGSYAHSLLLLGSHWTVVVAHLVICNTWTSFRKGKLSSILYSNVGVGQYTKEEKGRRFDRKFAFGNWNFLYKKKNWKKMDLTLKIFVEEELSLIL